MVKLEINVSRIVENYRTIQQLCLDQEIDLVTVAKLCLTHIDIVKPIIDAGAATIAETNLINLANLPYEVSKMLLRTAASDIDSGLDGCDYVLLSDIALIERLASSGARARGGVFVSIEMGDLREGVPLDELPAFIEQALAVPGITIEGIAANFGCLQGALPDHDSLDRLESAVRAVRRRTGYEFPRISLGGTVLYDMLRDGELRGRVNQVRIGEAMFFGHNMSILRDIPGLHREAMVLSAEIIELREKRVTGERADGYNAFGHRTGAPRMTGLRRRAVLDFGELAAPTSGLRPLVAGAEFAGATHDYAVLDVTEVDAPLSVGERVHFSVNYNSAAQAIISPYVEKEIVRGGS